MFALFRNPCRSVFECLAHTEILIHFAVGFARDGVEEFDFVFACGEVHEHLESCREVESLLWREENLVFLAVVHLCDEVFFIAAFLFDIDGENVSSVLVRFDIVVGESALICVKTGHVTSAREFGVGHKASKSR